MPDHVADRGGSLPGKQLQGAHMSRRLTISILVTTALCAAFIGLNPPPASAARYCGSAHFVEATGGARVTIRRGSLSCAQARQVASLWGSPRGTVHQPRPGRASRYTTFPGGW